MSIYVSCLLYLKLFTKTDIYIRIRGFQFQYKKFINENYIPSPKKLMRFRWLLMIFGLSLGKFSWLVKRMLAFYHPCPYGSTPKNGLRFGANEQPKTSIQPTE